MATPNSERTDETSPTVPPKEVIVTDTGNLIINLNNEYLVRVQSNVITDQSPKLKRQLHGDFKESFHHSCCAEKASTEPHRRDIMGDFHCDAVKNLLCLMHNRMDLLPNPLPAYDLVRLAVVVDFYEAREALLPHIRVLGAQAKLNDTRSTKLFVAAAIRFQDKEFFDRACRSWANKNGEKEYADRALYYLHSFDHEKELDGRAHSVIYNMESDINKADHKIARGIQEVITTLSKELATSKNDDRYRHGRFLNKCTCSRSISIAMLTELADEGLIPCVIGEPYSLPYRELRRKLAAIDFRYDYVTCHQCPEHMFTEVRDEIKLLKKNRISGLPCFVCLLRGSEDEKCSGCFPPRKSKRKVDWTKQSYDMSGEREDDWEEFRRERDEEWENGGKEREARDSRWRRELRDKDWEDDQRAEDWNDDSEEDDRHHGSEDEDISGDAYRRDGD